MIKDIIKHRDGTLSILVDDIEGADDPRVIAMQWFLEKDPIDRTTAIIRAWQDSDAWEAPFSIQEDLHVATNV